MAGRKKNQQIIFPLDSSESYGRAVESSDKVLVVFDVHATWSGPCTVMEPIFRKIFTEQEGAEAKIKIYTIDGSLLTADQKKLLPSLGSSKPLFVLFKSKVVVAKVPGANGPDLEAAILDNMSSSE